MRLRSTLCLVALWVVSASVPAVAQNHYPLEITQPPASAAQHRAGWAAPGKPYSIPVAVIGAAWPYTFELTNAPAGMTVKNAGSGETCGVPEAGRVHVICGEVNWLAPASGTFTPTVTVRDAAGATASRTWTVQVSAAPFRYVDAVNGRNASGNGCTSSCGDGSETNPWKSLKDVWSASAAGQIVYFKAGTYGVTDITRFSIGAEGEGIEFLRSRATTWLAYPGHAPVIDHGWPALRLQTWMWGPMIYVEGLTHRNGGSKYFHILADASQAGVFRKNTFETLAGDVSNAAFLMTPHSTPTYGLVIQDNRFLNAVGQLAIRLYDTTKTLIEANEMRGISNCFDPKDNATRFTFRANVCADIVPSRWGAFGISGSFNNGSGGEVYRNLFFNVAELALDLGATWTQPCNTPATYFYDNTLAGRLGISRICSPSGPFPFTRNVIVNDDGGNTAKPYFTRPAGFSDPNWALIVTVNNLTAAPGSGVITADGQLTGTARTQWLGQRGYELGGGSGGPSVAACGDGADNDGDGLIDLADPGCASATDTDETNAPPQPTCTFSIAPTSASVPAAGGTGSVQVTPSAPSCTFTASSASSWLTVAITGTSVGYTVSSNSGAARTGGAVIAGVNFTVSQAAFTPQPQPAGCQNGAATVAPGDVLVEQMSDGNATQRTAIAARVAALQRANFSVELTAKSTYTTLYATCRASQ